MQCMAAPGDLFAQLMLMLLIIYLGVPFLVLVLQLLDERSKWTAQINEADEFPVFTHGVEYYEHLRLSKAVDFGFEVSFLLFL